MKVRDVMTPDAVTVNLETSIHEAAQKMKANDIGALPVTDDERIQGMLTDRDIVVRCIAEGKDPMNTPARDAMTDNIKYVFEDQDISEAARSMMDLQMRRLVVLNRDKRLVGFVSMGDVSHKTQDSQLIAETAKHCSTPSRRQQGAVA